MRRVKREKLGPFVTNPHTKRKKTKKVRVINFTVKMLVQSVLVQNFRVLARDLKKLFRERNAYKSSESAKYKNTKRYEMKG